MQLSCTRYVPNPPTASYGCLITAVAGSSLSVTDGAQEGISGCCRVVLLCYRSKDDQFTGDGWERSPLGSLRGVQPYNVTSVNARYESNVTVFCQCLFAVNLDVSCCKVGGTFRFHKAFYRASVFWEVKLLSTFRRYVVPSSVARLLYDSFEDSGTF